MTGIIAINNKIIDEALAGCTKESDIRTPQLTWHDLFNESIVRREHCKTSERENDNPSATFQLQPAHGFLRDPETHLAVPDDMFTRSLLPRNSSCIHTRRST